MNSQYISDIIHRECQEYDLIVLKGFSPTLIKELEKEFVIFDDYCIHNGKIAIQYINETRLMQSIINYKETKKAICTCESFIKMCTQITGLDILQKKICVLENNMFELYPNPTSTDIPDFDNNFFEDTICETPLYSAFYAVCVHENGVQRVQYIDNYSESNKCVKIKYLIGPKSYQISGTICDSTKYRHISTRDGSLNAVMEELYNTMYLFDSRFVVEAEEADDDRLRVFVEAAKSMGQECHVYIISHNLSIEPRPQINETLKRIWGYDSFRSLKIYKDLNVDHEVTDISQGAIIETVVRQAEQVYFGNNDKVKNVLLTSPTGAGKSLLFQLSAIYIAENYGLLTLVISPLVALMNDQVEGLLGYNGIAALNSNKTAADKAVILRGVHERTVNILYLSPELLLSYTITSFIGDRKLGLLVVDEAHTVTTWGRDFRVDYWFLGDYLRKAKRILKYTFPIFALTATAVWDPTGKNDMVFDTIRSLNMDPCIKFIGVVRRTNITFEVSNSNITKNYEEKRNQLTIKRIHEALSAGRKTIVYFPFRSTVDAVVRSEMLEDIKDKVTRYHANLYPEEKAINVEAFRSGTKPIICATKAFGMGIDVSDIQEVYHHAPTGCLSDYVQEIGRLARDPNIKGIAKIDFSEGDFRYIRKLHGLSAIKPYQLVLVLKKLMAVYRMNGEKRNMLISASDFAYIFPHATNLDMVDQNLKSCLLLISNDLLNKLRFQAVIVRPKSLFSKCYIEVPAAEAVDFYRLYRGYLHRINNNVFILDADRLWTESYNTISFPQFKYKIAEGKVFKDFHAEIRNKVTLRLDHDVNDTRKAVAEFFDLAHGFLDEMSRSHHRIEFNVLKSYLPQSYTHIKREQFLCTFRMLYATPNALGGDVAAYCRVVTTQERKDYFQLIQSGYENVSNLYVSAYDRLINSTSCTTYCDPKDSIVKLSEFLNCLGVAEYQREGGDQPVIFVRVNNPHYLNMLIKNGNYKNAILESIYDKYQFSERIFTYFFTTRMTDKQRWDFIEAYFLGESEDKLLHFV